MARGCRGSPPAKGPDWCRHAARAAACKSFCHSPSLIPDRFTRGGFRSLVARFCQIIAGASLRAAAVTTLPSSVVTACCAPPEAGQPHPKGFADPLGCLVPASQTHRQKGAPWPPLHPCQDWERSPPRLPYVLPAAASSGNGQKPLPSLRRYLGARSGRNLLAERPGALF